jgi:rare lipoprotein A
MQWRAVCTAGLALALLLLALEGCGRNRVVTPAPASNPLGSVEGLATFYGPGFHGQRTASGSVFNQNHLVAAHPRYPFGTVVRVTNLENGRAVVVRIVDRGPVKRQQRNGVIIDVSAGAARQLRMVEDGVVKVRLDILAWGEAVDDNRADRR